MDRILLVEDERDVAEAVGLILNKEGYDVDIAYDLEGGYDKFNNNHYDIFILDIKLKDKESFPLLKDIRETKPESIILVITAYDSDENLDKAKSLGADAFIPKPLVLNFLRKFINDELRKIRERRRYGV